MGELALILVVVLVSFVLLRRWRGLLYLTVGAGLLAGLVAITGPATSPPQQPGDGTPQQAEEERLYRQQLKEELRRIEERKKKEPPPRAQPPRAGPYIENESYANPDDLRQTRKMLAELPASCSRSRASVSLDGTVTIRIRCEGTMDGYVKIKDGLVTDIR